MIKEMTRKKMEFSFLLPSWPSPLFPKAFALLWAFFSFVTSLSCSSLPFISENSIEVREIHIERLWVRSTLEDSYMKARFIHRTSPLFFKNLIIQGNSIDSVTAYDQKTKRQKWRLKLEGGIESNIYQNGEHLYFGANNGYFYSVHANTGQIRWKFLLNSEGLGAPLIHKGVVYFVTGKDILYALKEKNGEKIWIYKDDQIFSILSIRGVSRPAIHGNKIYVGFKSGNVLALNKKSGHLVWKTNLSSGKEFNDIDSEPVIDGSRIYISSHSGSLHALNLNTGREIWQVSQGGISSVTLQKNRIYYSTSDSQILSLDKKSGKILWSLKVKRGIATQPVLYKNLLIYGESEGFLQFVDALSGKKLKEFEFGQGVMSRPQIDPQKGVIYFLSHSANLFAIKLFWKSRKRKKLENIF